MQCFRSPNPFFARKSHEQCEKEWDMLMQQQFMLRCGIGGTGELTIFEQNVMTGEERAWWARKLEKVAEERSRKESSQLPPNLPH